MIIYFLHFFFKDLTNNFNDEDSKYENFDNFGSNNSNRKVIKFKQSCPNPDCNHKKSNKRNKKDTKQLDITNINDLIELGKSYHCKNNLYYNNLELYKLCKLVEPLTELKNLVGMEKVKKNMIEQIIYCLQNMHKSNKKDAWGNIINNDEMMHVIITGPPGVGKTELGKILGKLYKEMGILSKDIFKIVKRSDLIGEYLGQTAMKTQKVIDQCEGGILFIDEAYSLGNKENRDSFSKECIDTLNQNLSERKNFICIIAGYEDALEKCFFNANEGLKRRFPFKYTIEKYSPDQLRQIFELKVKQNSWELDNELLNEKKTEYYNFFEKNINSFPHFGGDIETLFLKAKIAHSNRIFIEKVNVDKHKFITFKDIDTAFTNFKTDRKSSNSKLFTNIYD